MQLTSRVALGLTEGLDMKAAGLLLASAGLLLASTEALGVLEFTGSLTVKVDPLPAPFATKCLRHRSRFKVCS